MSGIAGIIHFDGAPVEPGLVEKMTAAMPYRGPDGINHWVKGPVALGQCMLRTTPESLDETQPLTNEDESLVLVMDGRVDNWEELRRELLVCGAVLRTRADTELVLRAYEVWGEDCPDRIIGEYVFFIWDARQRRLFGARDAAGTRHFYYHSGNGWFGFASEIKGLLALGCIEQRLNESRLLDYLVVEFDRDDQVGTFYQGINRMPAGHAMRITEQDVKTWRYWNPGNLPAMKFASPDECTEAFLDQLRIAVQCRLRSIGPVGAMLSGGLDSSSIVGLISKEFRSALAQPLKTFSLIREDRENCPDWKSIQEILKDDWLDPTIITSAIAGEVSQSYLENIRNTDEPFAFTHGIGYEFVYAAASKAACRIVLDGMAGDLLFYGFDRSMSALLGRKAYTRLPAMLAAYRRHGINGGGTDFARLLAASVAPEGARTLYRRIRDRRKVRRGDLKQLHRETARRYLSMKCSQRNAAAGHRSDNDQLAHARNFTSGLLSFGHEVYGQLAFSKSVEPRSPFSDRRMIEFAIQMPVEAKLAMPWYKHLLRKNMAGILPEDVRWRTDIGGHPGWQFYERLIDSSAQNDLHIWNLEPLLANLSSWIDMANMKQGLGESISGTECAKKYKLFKLAMLAQWLASRQLAM